MEGLLLGNCAANTPWGGPYSSIGHSDDVSEANSTAFTFRTVQPMIPEEHALAAFDLVENSITAEPENSPVCESVTCIYMNLGLPIDSRHSLFSILSVRSTGSPETITIQSMSWGPPTAADSGGGPTSILETTNEYGIYIEVHIREIVYSSELAD